MATIEMDLGAILQKSNNRLDRIEQRIESNQTRTEEKLNIIDNRIIKLETKLETLKPSIQKIPDLSEKVDELKNWKQIALTIGGAFIGATITYLAKNSNP